MHHILATFGPTRLVRHFDGRHELIGGTADDHAAAREWCSLFAPEVVFTLGSRKERLTHPGRSAKTTKKFFLCGQRTEMHYSPVRNSAF